MLPSLPADESAGCYTKRVETRRQMEPRLFNRLQPVLSGSGVIYPAGLFIPTISQIQRWDKLGIGRLSQ